MTQVIEKRARRHQTIVEHDHGHRRASDRPGDKGTAGLPPPRRRDAPAGLAFLLALGVLTLTGMGVAKVRASTRVLELGAEITELTDQQTELLERKRRLSAERAYLRHPEQIREVAHDRLGMVPIAPELVQQIRIEETAP